MWTNVRGSETSLCRMTRYDGRKRGVYMSTGGARAPAKQGRVEPTTTVASKSPMVDSDNENMEVIVYWPKYDVHGIRSEGRHAGDDASEEEDDDDDISTAADTVNSDSDPMKDYENDDEDVVVDKVVNNVVDKALKETSNDQVVVVGTSTIVSGTTAGERRIIDLTLADELYVDLTRVDDTFVDLSVDEDDDHGYYNL